MNIDALLSYLGRSGVVSMYNSYMHLNKLYMINITDIMLYIG